MHDTPLEVFSDALADLVAKTSPSIVSIGACRSASSGFAWRSDLVVTADESLPDESELAVTPLIGGDRRKATVVGRDPSTDIALLRVEGPGLAPAVLARPSLRTGALALVVGAAGGAASSALGVIAHAGPAWHSMRGGAIDARIELDLRLRGRVEGGLVLDAAGRAIGMAVAGPRRRTLVIPTATIERVAPVLAEHGRIPRGYLGLGLQPVRVDGDGAGGVMIMSVAANGPGAAAGLVQGDVLVRWDGQPIPGVGALMRGLGPDSVGRAVKLGLRRAGQPQELTLTIGERPLA